MQINASSPIPGAQPGRAEQAGRAGQIAQGFGISPQKVIEHVNQLAQKLFEAGTRATQGQASASARPTSDGPQLRAPDWTGVQNGLSAAVASESRSPEAMLTLLIAKLQGVLAENSMNRLNERSQEFILRKQGAERAARAASQALEQARAALDGATTAAEEAAKASGAASEAAEAARKEAERLRAELDAMDPSAPEFEALKAQVEATEGYALELHEQAQIAATELDKAVQNLDKTHEKVEQADVEARQHSREVVAILTAPAPRDLPHAARLAGLLAQLNEIVAKNVQEKLQTDSEFAIKALQAREAENLKRSQEYQDQVEKAREAEKKMGCIGKIVGWVVTVVSVIAAPFTGGASMALAAVGLALAIAEEVTGKSLLGKIFEPLASVLQKVIQGVTQLVTSALKAAGVENAERLGQIIGIVLGAALVVAMMVAAVVLGKSAGAKVAAKFGGVLTEAIKRAMPAMLRSAARSVSSTAGQLSGSLSKSLGSEVGKNMQRVMNASVVMQAGTQVGIGAGQVVVADMQVEASKILAAMEVSQFDSQLLRDFLRQSQDTVVQWNELIQRLYQQLSSVQLDASNTASSVISNLRTA